MGNPWAPPDSTQPPGTRAPEQHAPTAPGDPVGPRTQQVPPGPHPPRPAPPPPDPAGVVRATRTSAWSAGVLLLGVVLVGAPYPALFVAPLAAVGALTLAILAVVRAARARAQGPVVALSVVLVVASLGWTGVSAQTLLYADAAREHHRCEAAALTQQAQRACAAQLERDMSDRLGSLVGIVGRPTTSP